MCSVLSHVHPLCPARGEVGAWPWQTGRTQRSESQALILLVPFEEAGGLLVATNSPGECFLQIQDIVRKQQLLTIFREGKDGQQDVDVAILQALLKGEGQVTWGQGEELERGCPGPSLEEPQTLPLGGSPWSEGSWCGLCWSQLTPLPGRGGPVAHVGDTGSLSSSPSFRDPGCSPHSPSLRSQGGFS